MDKKILVVDDKPLIRALMEHILGDLEDQGVELLLAASGEKGLELALDQRPDLIFLDVNMPHLSGYEVCKRIKAADSETYVILLTGQVVEEERGAQVGADECIAKPFYPDYILERVTAILELDC